MAQHCLVCATQVPDYHWDHPNGARVRCPVCGTYRLMERAAQLLAQRRQYTAGYVVVPNRRLSAALREQAERGREPVLDDPDVIEQAYEPAADLPEVVGRILRHLRVKAPHGHTFVRLVGHQDYGVAGAESPEAFDHAVGEAVKLGWIERKAVDEVGYRLTMAGWKHLQELPDMERAEPLQVADRVMRAVYDQDLQGGYDAAELVRSLRLDVGQLARALRYAERQGWITTDYVHGEELPVGVTITPSGMRHVEASDNARPTPAPNVVYNLTGPGARVNVNSHDASVNVVNVDSNTLFGRIEQAVSEGVSDAATRDQLLACVRELRAAPDGPTRAARLGQVLQVGANVMTVLSPFMPALTQIVAQP